MTMLRRMLLGSACALALHVGVPVAAQDTAPRLSLAQALRLAERRAFANRGATAAADAARAAADGAWRGVLPSITAEAAAIRTTDPIGAFGFALKQRAVTQASFSPASLNDPAAIGNYGAGLVLEQPLANVDAWMGLRAARAAADAAATDARWTATTVHRDVVEAYYGAVVAAELATAMMDAEKSAREHVRLADAAVTNGFATRSDALLARVRAGDVTARRLEAESNARVARASLAMLLGVPVDTTLAVPQSVPAPADVLARVPQPGMPIERGDVLAARASTRAAHLDLDRAQAEFLPRVNGFARYDWNSPARIGGGAPSWTIGAAASWSLFGGGREVADSRAASAHLRAAEARADGANAAAQLDQRSADEAFGVALARAAIADTSALQSAEALRIVRKKYDGGLATVSELLDAGAAETQARVMQTDSRFRVLVAAAERLRAWGADPMALIALDPDPR